MTKVTIAMEGFKLQFDTEKFRHQSGQRTLSFLEKNKSKISEYTFDIKYYPTEYRFLKIEGYIKHNV